MSAFFELYCKNFRHRVLLAGIYFFVHEDLILEYFGAGYDCAEAAEIFIKEVNVTKR